MGHLKFEGYESPINIWLLMSHDLLLLTADKRLDMTHLRGTVLEAELLTPWLRSSKELTLAEITDMADCYARFLDGYRINLPPFPHEALLEFTELGPYWVQLVLEAKELYIAGDIGFDAALEEIMATVQIDIEEDHWIPYSKHRHYDTLLCFKAEYDGTVWQRASEDHVLQRWDYDYIAHLRDELQQAVAAGCSAVWSY